MKEKTYVEDVERSLYDFKNEEKDVYRMQAGLTPDIVEKISKEKGEGSIQEWLHQEAWL